MAVKWTPKLISQLMLYMTLNPYLEVLQLNRPTANTARPNRKLLTRGSGRSNGNARLQQDSFTATQVNYSGLLQ